MMIIVNQGLNNSDRSRLSRLLATKAATKLGTAYEIDNIEGIPAGLATIVAQPQQVLRDSQQKLQQLVDGITFLFQFFNQNKARVAITTEDKAHLKNILALVKQT